jgi:RNA polymerase sigma-70 factor (ECF subfamily)
MDLRTAYTDNELLALLQTGHMSAFDEIYRRYLPSLYDVVYKRLKCTAYSEDILQEVFARLWLKRESLQIEDLAAYLHTAVRNATINFITRNKEKNVFFEPFETMLSENESTDGKLLEKEMVAFVYAYAETLPEKRRAIFLHHIKDRLTTREIATLLHVSQKTVQNQLATALKGLRSNLTPILLIALAWHSSSK